LYEYSVRPATAGVPRGWKSGRGSEVSAESALVIPTLLST